MTGELDLCWARRIAEAFEVRAGRPVRVRGMGMCRPVTVWRPEGEPDRG